MLIIIIKRNKISNKKLISHADNKSNNSKKKQNTNTRDIKNKNKKSSSDKILKQ